MYCDNRSRQDVLRGSRFGVSSSVQSLCEAEDSTDLLLLLIRTSAGHLVQNIFGITKTAVAELSLRFIDVGSQQLELFKGAQ